MQVEFLVVGIMILLISVSGGLFKKPTTIPPHMLRALPSKRTARGGFFDRFRKDKKDPTIEELRISLKSELDKNREEIEEMLKSRLSLKQVLSDPVAREKKWNEIKQEARLSYEFVMEGVGVVGKLNNFINVAVNHPRTSAAVLLTWYACNKIFERDMRA
jgi:hypothetical protein